MMLKMKAGKASRAPTQHVGFDFVHGVPSRSRPKPADRLPAGATIDFCRSTYVELWTKLDAFDAILDIANDAAADAKAGVALKVIEAFLEVIWLEGEIAVHLDDKLPVIVA